MRQQDEYPCQGFLGSSMKLEGSLISHNDLQVEGFLDLSRELDE